MTQQELAQVTGISAPRISEYENGRRDPTVDTLLKLLAGTDHTVSLVGAPDATFPNPHLNARQLVDVLELADALTAAKASAMPGTR